MDRRFAEESSTLYYWISALLPKSPMFLKEELLRMAKIYDIDPIDVKDELRTLNKLYFRKFLQCNDERKEADLSSQQPHSLRAFKSFLDDYQEPFYYTHYLTTIASCLSISSTGCERTFSCVKRIKNYMRTTMSHERLGSLDVIAVGANRPNIRILKS